MPVARSRAIALIGMRGEIVEVEVDLADGIPAFNLIGLPDTALGEARQRVRSAAANSQCELPNRKFTVNLSPAALPKHGSGFDLAIALVMLAAGGTVSAASVEAVVHIGELGLDGRVRSVPGVLPAVLAAKRLGCATVLVPAASAREASLVDGVRVVPVATLRDAAIWHGAQLEPEDVPPPPAVPAAVEQAAAAPADLSDVVGNEEAVRALTLAAVGGHHLFLLGPPGAGKTMLATRLPGILPELDTAAAIECASVRSLSGLSVDGLSLRPPFEAPHHTASTPSIVGGGSGIIRPGAIARAAHGVLFLDEAPEFSRVALDALRQPLETGVITIQRANATAHFPANVQLVLAANPCPCGRLGEAECSCTPMARRRYLGRLSGPLLDRVDLQLTVRRITATGLRAAAEPSGRVSTAAAARAVRDARAATVERLSGTPWRRNADVPGSWLRARPRRPSREALAVLDRALERGAITMRGYDRVLRIAWSLADLGSAGAPGRAEIGEALGYRTVAAA
ncbi:MAG TPA: YifB family Mg chelatase-like AAA ATPase [Microbacteriaceae bacterium]|nr:YifB family Mg chelatase-like AAA ATPase [Microbacteriaceae bacterium]